MFDIFNRFHACQNQTDLLAVAVEEVRAFFRSDRALVYQFYPNHTGEIVADSASETATVIDPTTGEQWRQQLAAINTPQVINSCEEIGFPSLVFPIPIQGEIWGLLIIKQNDQVSQEEDIETLEPIINQLAIALQQLITQEQLQAERQQRQQLEQELRTTKKRLQEAQGILKSQGVIQNLTQQPEAEAAAVLEDQQAELRYVSQRLQIAIQAAEMGIWEWDFVSDRLIWDQRMYEIFGVDPDAFTGTVKSWQDTLHPEDAAETIHQIERAIQGEQEFVTEFRIIHPDGSIRWIEAQSLLVRNEQGKPERIIGSNIDITDYKQATAERQNLIQELSTFKAALDEAAVVAITDSQGVITYVNDAFCNLSGYSRKELMGQTDHLMKSDYHPPEFFEDLWATLHSGEVWRGEICNRTKQGDFYWVNSTLVPFLDETGQPFQYLGIHFDITERKAAETALVESQQFIEAILDSVPFPIFWKNRDSVFLGCNQTYANLTRLPSPAAVEGKTDFDFLLHTSQIEKIHQDDQEVMRSGQPKLGVEQHIINIAQQETWVEVNRAPLRNSRNEVIGLVTTIQDISERKAANLAMKRQLAAIEAAVDGISISQGDTYLYLNQAHVELLGYESQEELLGQSWRSFYSPEQVTWFEQEVFPTLAKKGFWQGEAVATRKDGSTFDQGISLTLTDEGLMICVCQDITERKQTEFALQASETQFRRVFESNVVGMMFTDFSGQITDANDQFLDIIGYSRADLEAERINWVEITPPEHIEADERAKEQLQRHGEIQPFEKEYLRSDGKRVSVLLGVALLSEKDARCVCVVVDISDRKAAEAELQRTNSELERATRLKDEFLANMSHELRTPLNAILGMTEGLKEQIYGSLNPKQMQSLDTIERSGSHLLSLINDILDLSKIESGKMELDRASTAVEPLCQSAFVFIKQQAYKKQIKLETQLPSNLPKLWIDERRIRQVLINLLTNAVKFTPEGGKITLSVNTKKETTSRPAAVQIAVSDTGIGIRQENLNQLFQPFVQVDSTLNRKYEGTGLGLALVKRTVELHGGEVSVSSEVGVGSCFTIELPYMMGAASAETTTPSDLEITVTEEQTPALILMAEDNSANILTMKSYLEAKGYRLIVANNGLEAINLARSQQPDLILMDIQMPDLDGLEAIQQIRSDGNETVPIIALTALAMENDRDRCLEAGANDYLTKPVRLKELVTTIENFLNRD
ncbi:multi-sensor hybrid histidine kinase [Halothece sp. PCC 7418]|uniref:PAS domain S-box protein n=1 Tax=Halothece sp. (strain PCC 7418) TaxID=65093 RepID=UPI0002A07890|nr:PAS domain S-box protein [Halothece sp. PCC 7418]AFZ45918.1 multi-sensor hybrid histidine kinase [Halothece sp. PCC 7418]